MGRTTRAGASKRKASDQADAAEPEHAKKKTKGAAAPATAAAAAAASSDKQASKQEKSKKDQKKAAAAAAAAADSKKPAAAKSKRGAASTAAAAAAASEDEAAAVEDKPKQKGSSKSKKQEQPEQPNPADAPLSDSEDEGEDYDEADDPYAHLTLEELTSGGPLLGLDGEQLQAMMAQLQGAAGGLGGLSLLLGGGLGAGGAGGGAEEEEENPVHNEFMEEVHAKEAALGKHCLIMGQVETEEDVTIEDLRGLTRVFVPEQAAEIFAEVWEELDAVGHDTDDEEEGEEEEEEEQAEADEQQEQQEEEGSEGAAGDADADAGDGDGADGSEQEEGGGEGDELDGDELQPDVLESFMKAMLGGKLLGTEHSLEMHSVFNNHLDTIDASIKSKDWQQAFCRWAALLMAAHREKHWYEDTDELKAAEAIYGRMRAQWLKLKARSDEELGGLVAEGDKTPVQEFDAYLQAVADDMRTMDYNVPDAVPPAKAAKAAAGGRGKKKK